MTLAQKAIQNKEWTDCFKELEIITLSSARTSG